MKTVRNPKARIFKLYQIHLAQTMISRNISCLFKTKVNKAQNLTLVTLITQITNSLSLNSQKTKKLIMRHPFFRKKIFAFNLKSKRE